MTDSTCTVCGDVIPPARAVVALPREVSEDLEDVRSVPFHAGCVPDFDSIRISGAITSEHALSIAASVLNAYGLGDVTLADVESADHPNTFDVRYLIYEEEV